MFFNEFIGIDAKLVSVENARHAVKGILVRNNKVLLLESNRGDYTFPGGGIKTGESHYEAIKREIIEETGRKCIWIGKNIGQITLHRRDIYDVSKMYELISYYYPIKTSDIIYDLKLSVGEKRFDLRPTWVDIDVAIRKNRKHLESDLSVDFWISQELYVLEFLKKEGEKALLIGLNI